MHDLGKLERVVRIDKTAPEPLYRQLADLLRGQIERGQLPQRTAVPSLVKLAADYDVSVITVRKAIQVLKDEGLIITVSGRGTFVAER